MASSGLFLVCFDSSSLKPQEVSGDEYYARVGTYLDLVTQTAALADIKPKIMLVATKLESLDRCQGSLDKILDLAKAHLASTSSESFLVADILKTPAKIACKEAFQEMYGKIYTLCTAEELRSRPKEAIPTFWYRLLTALKELPHISVDEVILKLQQIKAKETGPPTIPKDQLESLEKLREVMKYLTEVNDSKPKAKPRSTPAASSSDLKSNKGEKIKPASLPQDQYANDDELENNEQERLGSREEGVTILEFFKALVRFFSTRKIQLLARV